MPDENKPPEGGSPKPAGDGSDITKRLEQLEARNSELQSLVDRYSAEAKEYRKAKEESEQAARERERKALEEQGQFKTIAEQQKAELDRITQEATATKAALESAQAQLDAIVSAQREELLALIPEGEERDKWKDASLDVLRNAAPLYAKANGSPPPKGGPAGSYKGGAPDFADMTDAEQITYAREHGMSAQEIIRARQKAAKK